MVSPDDAHDTHDAHDTADPWRRLLDEARHQHGVVQIGRASHAGCARSTIDDRIRREGWDRPYPKIALLPGSMATDGATLAFAAALSVGQPAAITGMSALALHGVADQWPDPVSLVLPASVRRVAPPGVSIRRTRTLLPGDVQRRGDVGVASVPRAFLDAAAASSHEQLRALLIDARQRRRTTVERIAERARRSPSTPGRGRLLAACTDVQRSGADSVLVHHAERLLRSEGIVIDVPPRTVRTSQHILHPDITIRTRPVAIEADGFGFHASRRELDLDQRKHNAYLLAGWNVLRVGWDRLDNDRAGFLAELRTAIERAPPRPMTTHPGGDVDDQAG